MEQVESSPTYSPHLKKVLKSYQTAAMTSLNGPDTFMANWDSHHIAVKNAVLPTADDVDLKALVKNSALAATNPCTDSRCKSPSNHAAVPKSPAVVVSAAENGTRNFPSKKKFFVPPTQPPAQPPSTTTPANVTSKYVEYDPFLAPPPFPIQQVPILAAPDQSRSERSETVLEGETISCFIVGGEKRLCLPQILNTVLRDFSLQQINAICDDLQIFCSRCNHEQLEVLKVTGILPLTAPSCGLITKTDAERLCSALLHMHPPRAMHDLPPEKRPFHFKIYHECFGKCKGIYTPAHYTSVHARCIECTECSGLFSPQKFVGHAHKSLENRTCHWGFDSTNWMFYILLAKDQEKSATEQLQSHLDDMKSRFDATKNSNGTPINGNSKRKQTVDAGTEKELMKKAKYEETYYPYVYDPMLVYMYGGMPTQSRISAFRPWSPVITKDGKLALPTYPASFARESIPQQLPQYLSHGPPVLLNPERVVPISETERFERHYQPNVALAPPSAQIQALQKSSYTTASSGGGGGGHVNVSSNTRCTAVALTTKRQPPAGPSTGQISSSSVMGNPEMELSTDTDETFSDTATTCSSMGSPSRSPNKYKSVGDGETLVSSMGEKPQEENEDDDDAPTVDVAKELQEVRELLEEEGLDKNLQTKVLSRVFKMCGELEQKLLCAVESRKRLRQELEYTRMSKRERLREAAETKHQLRKEMERMCEEQMRREREMEEMKKEASSLRHCKAEKNHEACQINVANEHLRMKIDSMGEEMQKMQEELSQLRHCSRLARKHSASPSSKGREEVDSISSSNNNESEKPEIKVEVIDEAEAAPPVIKCEVSESTVGD